jgi:galactose mutarotase-like enzyme
METFEYQGRKIHRWSVGASTFLVDPVAGARLISWFVEMADGSVRDVIHWPEDADYENIGKVRGGNPILFPFAGRCHVDGKSGLWQDLTGKTRPMPQHGFARDSVFELQDASETRFRAVLLADEKAVEAYPYNYEFQVSYFFNELGFLVELSLRNLEEFPIPWSPGHHFYFTLPWHEGLIRDSYEIQIPAKRALRHLENGELQPEELEKRALCFNFEDASLVNRIHTHLKGSECKFGPKGGEEFVTVRFKEPESLPSSRAFVTWTESKNAPFYCVEPWMGPPNSPAHKNGLQFVNPGQAAAFTVEVSLA